jgi:PIN domain nuclease of toxin-antitoxin system
LSISLAEEAGVVAPLHGEAWAGTLPFHHRDPFDRMLIAQAIVEGMSLVSSDPAIDAYGVPRLW